VKTVRRRSEARWLPSRHRFAIFRLYGLLRLAMATNEAGSADIALTIDRDQSNDEQYAVALLVFATVTSYLAVLLPFVTPVAIAMAIPLSGFAVQVPVFIVGSLLPRWRNNLSINSVVLMATITAASIYFARGGSWAHFVAWFFLGTLIANGAAWCIVFLLRGRIAEIDRLYGGEAFEA
jgi:hypothetical protein